MNTRRRNRKISEERCKIAPYSTSKLARSEKETHTNTSPSAAGKFCVFYINCSLFHAAAPVWHLKYRLFKFCCTFAVRPRIYLTNMDENAAADNPTNSANDDTIEYYPNSRKQFIGFSSKFRSIFHNQYILWLELSIELVCT